MSLSIVLAILQCINCGLAVAQLFSNGNRKPKKSHPKTEDSTSSHQPRGSVTSRSYQSSTPMGFEFDLHTPQQVSTVPGTTNTEPLGRDSSTLSGGSAAVTAFLRESAIKRNFEALPYSDDQPDDQPSPISQRLEVSPWEVNFDWNLHQSRIIRLPDELLLRIMQAAEPAELYMLRQVSFTFWRIYQSKEFNRFYRDYRDVPYLSTRKSGWAADDRTVQRAKKNAFCAECLPKRRSRQNKLDRKDLIQSQKLYCSHCRTKHGRLSFSIQQRFTSQQTRRCIASEGSLRLCPHLTISAASIWREANMLASGVDNNECSLDGKVFRRCQQCMDLALLATPKDQQWYIEPPTLSLANSHNKSMRLRCSWQMPLFVIPERDTITTAFLSGKLERFLKVYGDAFCPHFSTDNGQALLRALDPQYCSCLGGDSRVGCRIPYSKERWGRYNCKQSEYVFHSVRCEDCFSSYSFERVDQQVYLSRETHCDLPLKQKEVRLLRRTCGLQYCLDPKSYGASLDHETKHFFWCLDPGCRHYKGWLKYKKYDAYIW
ncbi:hypothetical protein LZ30DRAFT_715574 [Colletotrichum cereale]|nr:hypothetical protein LZ30DRAFT_715574 [Colletotrichum cereale]